MKVIEEELMQLKGTRPCLSEEGYHVNIRGMAGYFYNKDPEEMREIYSRREANALRFRRGCWYETMKVLLWFTLFLYTLTVRTKARFSVLTKLDPGVSGNLVD